MHFVGSDDATGLRTTDGRLAAVTAFSGSNNIRELRFGAQVRERRIRLKAVSAQVFGDCFVVHHIGDVDGGVSFAARLTHYFASVWHSFCHLISSRAVHVSKLLFISFIG